MGGKILRDDSRSVFGGRRGTPGVRPSQNCTILQAAKIRFFALETRQKSIIVLKPI